MKKKTDILNYKVVAIISIILLFLISCKDQMEYHQAPVKETVKESIKVPSAHLWQYLYNYGSEKAGYGSYSYVLVGRDENNTRSTSIYLRLVAEIQHSTEEAGAIPKEVSRSIFNLFLIPVTGASDTSARNPDYKLSIRLLNALATSSPLDFNNPGPYIITLTNPITYGNETDIADIFYVDLTDIHPDAIPEFVRAYKKRVTDENLNGIERLKSLRLSILNLACIGEDKLGFAKNAYAALQDAFLKESIL